MSIASRIQSITTHLSNAYDKLSTKGATMPQDKNIENLESTIDTITGGSSGDLQIDLSVDYLENITWEQGNINGSNGAFTPASTGSYWTSDYIDVSMLDNFTLLQNSSNFTVTVYNACFFDSNKNFLQRSAAAASSMGINGGIVAIIPVPINAKYFRMAMIDTIRDLMKMYKVSPGTTRIGGEWTSEGILLGREPYGDIVINTSGAGANYAFAGKAGITSLKVTGMTAMGTHMFEACTELKSVKFVGITGGIGGHCFQNCTKLKIADFDAPSQIVVNCFNACRTLNTLILRKSTSIVMLHAITAFNTTPFAQGGSGGEIYIPKALYDHLGDGTALDYKSATNWSIIDGYGTITWKQIEGSEYEE